MSALRRSAGSITVIAAAMLLILFLSCSSPVPAFRGSKPAPRTAFPPISRNFVPAGWNDITPNAKDPSILRWLVNSDRSATMVLREFSVDDSSARMLLRDDRCVPAQVSMRMRIEQYASRYRITRMPGPVAGEQSLCFYVYVENGLLRRVITFALSGKFYELELFQERPSDDFHLMGDEQLRFVKGYTPR